MSSSNLQRRLVLVGLAALAGCGFTPAYGPGGSAEALRGSILVAPPKNRQAYELVKQLELRLGQPAPARYALNYTLRIRRDGVGLTSRNETTRFNLVGTLGYSLTPTGSDKVVTSGTVQGFTGYSVGSVDATVTPPSTSSTISTSAAERDANDRLMIILADQLVTRLIATSGAWLK